MDIATYSCDYVIGILRGFKDAELIANALERSAVIAGRSFFLISLNAFLNLIQNNSSYADTLHRF